MGKSWLCSCGRHAGFRDVMPGLPKAAEPLLYQWKKLFMAWKMFFVATALMELERDGSILKKGPQLP